MEHGKKKKKPALRMLISFFLYYRCIWLLIKFLSNKNIIFFSWLLFAHDGFIGVFI